MTMITFDAACHRRHRLKCRYSARELRAHLEQGTLYFYCPKCDATRPPTPAEALTLTQMVIRSEAREEAVVSTQR